MKDIWKLYNDEQQYEKLMETIKGKTIENADLYYDVLNQVPKGTFPVVSGSSASSGKPVSDGTDTETDEIQLAESSTAESRKQEVQRLINEWEHYYSGKKPAMQILKEVEEHIKEY